MACDPNLRINSSELLGIYKITATKEFGFSSSVRGTILQKIVAKSDILKEAQIIEEKDKRTRKYYCEK